MKKFKGNAIQRKSIQGGGMGLFFGSQVSKQFDDNDGAGDAENEEVSE